MAKVPEVDAISEAEPAWTIHVDGASNLAGYGAGLILADPDGESLEYALHFVFQVSNNQAEYEALLAGLRIINELGIDQLRVFSNSHLVVNQVKGEFEARDPTLAKYLNKVQNLISQLRFFEILHILCLQNSRTDALSRLATTAIGTFDRTFVEHLQHPSIMEEPTEVHQVEQETSWIYLIFAFLTKGTIPEDLMEAKRVCSMASKYVVLDGILYKRSFS